MADEASPVDASVALWPGIVAAGLCGALALSDGPGVAAGVAGLLVVPMGLASLAGASLREGEARDGVPPAVATLIAGPAMALLGSILKANTHHKALAGVTFALIALGVILGGLALGARGRQLLSGRMAAAAAMGLAALLLGALVLRGGAAGLVDVALATAAVGLGALVPLRPSKPLGGAAAVVLALGLVAGVTLGGRPDLAPKIQARSLLASGVLLPLAREGSLTPG